MPSPRLERLLLDADVSPELEPLLKAIAFRVQFALRVRVNIRSDTAILRWAGRHRHILVCHDKHKDKATRLELFPELYKNGGKIIQIGGAPEQHPLTALGKILLHREKWLEFFENNDGRVVVHEQGVRFKNSLDLYTRVQGQLDIDPVKAIKARKPYERKRRKKVVTHPPEQLPLRR